MESKPKMENKPVNEALHRLIREDVKIGERTKIYSFTNLYGCNIGSDCMIGTFVEIQSGATVGNRTRIQSHSFVCEGVHIKDRCFIGHGVVFINDNKPRAVNEMGENETKEDWADRFVETVIEDDVVIGSNATILGGITIGKGAVIGAGSVVTKDVPPGETWVGNPAKQIQQ